MGLHDKISVNSYRFKVGSNVKSNYEESIDFTDFYKDNKFETNKNNS